MTVVAAAVIIIVTVIVGVVKGCGGGLSPRG
jgi:hypothetical protein